MKTLRSKQVRALLGEGKSINEVCALAGVSKQYVYQLRWSDKKLAEKKAATSVKVKRTKRTTEIRLAQLESDVAELRKLIESQPKTFGEKVRALFN